jgi:hypothetical protein
MEVSLGAKVEVAAGDRIMTLELEEGSPYERKSEEEAISRTLG